MFIQDSLSSWFQRHRDEVDAVVFDIDGVLIAGGVPLPGGLEFTRLLRGAQVPLALLTNDGNHSVAQKARHLARHGYDFSETEITSCSDGLVEAVQALGCQGRQFFIIGNLGDPCYAAKAGLRGTRELALLPHCDGIISSEDGFEWEPVINAVVNFVIAHPDRPYLVSNPDEYYPNRHGTITIAAGGIARFIQRVVETYGVKFQPTYLGKPYQPIFAHSHHTLERRLGRRVRRDRVLMIGDSLASDILGAHNFGYRSALLLTGITRETHLPAAAVRPTYVFRGF